MSIRWKRSVDGFVESHDGRWKITPNYFSCVNAQSFRLVRDGKTVSHTCQTQRDAKAEADRLVQADDPQTPRFQYDCKRCKFSWCCGPTCHCGYMHTLPEPPRERQDEVDQALVQLGYKPQFHGEGAQRR